MIYVNGCGYTEGHTLEDKTKSWPYILGKKINVEDNKIFIEADYNVSNQYIVRSTISTLCEFINRGEKPEMVVIGFTDLARREFFHAETAHLVHGIPRGEYIPNPEFSDESNERLDILNKIYMTDLYAPVYDFHVFMNQVILLQTFFEKHDIKYIMFSAKNFTNDLLDDTDLGDLCIQAKLTHLYSMIDRKKLVTNTTMFRYIYENDKYNGDKEDPLNMFPNEEAHSDWADILFDLIQR